MTGDDSMECSTIGSTESITQAEIEETVNDSTDEELSHKKISGTISR